MVQGAGDVVFERAVMLVISMMQIAGWAGWLGC